MGASKITEVPPKKRKWWTAEIQTKDKKEKEKSPRK